MKLLAAPLATFILIAIFTAWLIRPLFRNAEDRLKHKLSIKASFIAKKIKLSRGKQQSSIYTSLQRHLFMEVCEKHEKITCPTVNIYAFHLSIIHIMATIAKKMLMVCQTLISICMSCWSNYAKDGTKSGSANQLCKNEWFGTFDIDLHTLSTCKIRRSIMIVAVVVKFDIHEGGWILSQVRRRDVVAEGDTLDDSRLETAHNVMTTGEVNPETLSASGSEGDIENLHGKVTIIREMAKVIIGFGQVLSSFQYVYVPKLVVWTSCWHVLECSRENFKNRLCIG